MNQKSLNICFLLLIFFCHCKKTQETVQDTGGIAFATVKPPEDEAVSGNSTSNLNEKLKAKDKDSFSLRAEVSTIQLPVRDAPNADAEILGWVRLNAEVRVKPKGQPSSSCSSGWFEIAPKGWVCAGQGLVFLKDTKPSHNTLSVAALPYDYFLVKEPMVAEYHRLPSGAEEQQVLSWIDRIVNLQEKIFTEEQELAEQKFPSKKKQKLLDEKKLLVHQALLGQGEQEFEKPKVVRRFLFRGFFVASAGEEERGVRIFLRTPQGSFVRRSRLSKREGTSFEGVQLNRNELGEIKPGEVKLGNVKLISDAHQVDLQLPLDHPKTLPIAFAVRSARPLIKIEKEDGSLMWKKDDAHDVIPRRTVIDSWIQKERIGNHFYHVLEGERYLREWFVGVAEKIKPPFQVETDEPWVHVDLSAQTLVLYKGHTPIFTTLVSSGLNEHETPSGVFSIEKKWTTATMSHLGPDAGDDRYRIEDVPWVQYFDGSIALHGAFWHHGFGLQKSHGCINLSPKDAKFVFEHLWPLVPEGWHGVNVKSGAFKTSRVVVTP